MTNERKSIPETIQWIDVTDQLPDAGTEVLICFERNDCYEREVTIGTFDDSDPVSPWEVPGDLMHFGIVLFWAEVPAGSRRS